MINNRKQTNFHFFFFLISKQIATRFTGLSHKEAIRHFHLHAISSFTMKITIPHFSCYTYAIPNITLFGKRFIKYHAEQIDTIVKSANEKIYLQFKYVYTIILASECL